MIIKKKYTAIKKTDKEIPVTEEPVIIQSVDLKKEENTGKEVKKQEKSSDSNPGSKEDTKKRVFDDLDLSLENIKFEQRAERREGTRRRGYRRTQDRNVVTRAQKDADSIKEVAKQEGYQEGLKAAQKDLDDLKSKFEEFFKYKNEVFEKVSACIMDISIEIAQKILNKEVETERTYIISLIKNAVEEVNKTENKITLKVMPKDVEIVKDKVSDIFPSNDFEAKISVIPDNEIKDGGVIVETSNGIIDATIETQLAIMEKALKKQEESQGK